MIGSLATEEEKIKRVAEHYENYRNQVEYTKKRAR